MEIWKDIKGYEGIYQVSNCGQVRSLDHYASNGAADILYKGVILSQNKSLPYNTVRLRKKTHYVHRLVAEAFVLNESGCAEVNHKDENKRNNNADNLEWCSKQYNLNYGTARERSASKKRGVQINNKPIMQCTIKGEPMSVYDSASKASVATGVDNSTICKAANGKKKTAGGFCWRWLNG